MEKTVQNFKTLTLSAKTNFAEMWHTIYSTVPDHSSKSFIELSVSCLVVCFQTKTKNSHQAGAESKQSV